MGSIVERNLAKHGRAAIESAWRHTTDGEAGPPTLRQLVFAMDDELNPVPSRMSLAERKAAEKDEVVRRLRAKAAAMGATDAH
jgi:hypothetical protein